MSFFVMVCYDIPDDKKRYKIASILEGYGRRVQESVFECEVTAEQFKKMKTMIKKVIDAGNDSVRYYTLCANCIEKIEIQGTGELKRDEKYYIV